MESEQNSRVPRAGHRRHRRHRAGLLSDLLARAGAAVTITGKGIEQRGT